MALSASQVLLHLHAWEARQVEAAEVQASERRTQALGSLRTWYLPLEVESSRSSRQLRSFAWIRKECNGISMSDRLPPMASS